MVTFRRVEDRRAGPAALGILVPPGLRTVVILRPRPLRWDLLPLRPAGQVHEFCTFSRDEAAGVARQVQRALEQAAKDSGKLVGPSAAPGGGFQVCCHCAGFRWVACLRVPGQPYEPANFGALEEALAAAAHLAPFLGPAADAPQEFYFNTQNFSR